MDKTWKRNTEKISDFSRFEAETLNQYRKYAEARRNRRVYKQEQVGVMLRAFLNYREDKLKHNKPMTVAGTLLALDLNDSFWLKIKNGDYDYLLEEYIEVNNINEEDIYYNDLSVESVLVNNQEVMLIPFSKLWEKIHLAIQEQREEACSSTRGNPAGNIFLLKAQQGFKEEDSPSYVNQTLVIADKEKALEALKLLK